MLQEIEFNPIQPEWYKALSHYRQVNFPFPTNQHIAYMYEFEISSSSLAYIPGIPDACIDFIFCADGKKESNIVVASPPNRVLMKFHKNVRYTGIRLLPQQRIFNFQIPLKQLFQNITMPLFDVTNFPYFLYEQLIMIPQLEEKANFLNNCLHKHPYISDSKSEIVNACIQKITNYQGILKIKELENYTGFSERYLRNIFNENLGLAPKQFIQLYRFQITVQKMYQYNTSQLKKLINNELFYDESHLYKNFRKYVNMTPKEYAIILKA